ncbi:minor capsid protein [Paenibacillus sp. MBLB4367]|uniref:minor capsid protein n=1 Tax=Paenibacillus sp. MBLB4367 TaxID=3384767 RepID=UPI0039081BF7
MFTVSELKQYFVTNMPYTYYANEFPTQSTTDAAFVRLTGGFPPSQWTPKKRPSFQVLMRGSETGGPALEAKANSIFGHLHNRAEFVIGTTRIVHCSSDQSSPLYLGRDENNRPLYSLNFTCVVME